jgi:phosphatidate cytidylyltransferase
MTRAISGILLAAAVVVAILFLPFIALRVVVCAVAALAADEYLRITGTRDQASRWSGIAAVIYVCWWSAVPAPLSIVILAMIVVGWLAFEVLRQGLTVQAAAVNLIAPVYIGAPLGMLVALQTLAGSRGTLVLIGTIVVSDSAQYFTGRAFGRRPLAPAISPKKTIEGAFGGIVLGTLFMVVALGALFPATPIVVRVLLGMIVVFLGIFGDLFESRLKRLADMKDSSSLIPGHGGVLDRIDALLFAIPFFYFMVLQGRVA